MSINTNFSWPITTPIHVLNNFQKKFTIIFLKVLLKLFCRQTLEPTMLLSTTKYYYYY